MKSTKAVPARNKTYQEDIDEQVRGLAVIIAAHKELDDPLGRLAYFLQTSIALMRGRLATFTDRFAKHPLDAFEWADDAVEAAAKLNVHAKLAAVVVRKYEDGTTTPIDIAAGVKRYAFERLVYLGTYPSLSTGQVKNLAARAELAAYAELFDGLRAIFEEVRS